MNVKKFCASYLFLVFSFLLINKISAEEKMDWGDCLIEAKNNHPDLISAEEGVNQQKAGKVITASGLYPQINGAVDVSTGKMNGSNTGGGDSDTTDSYSYGITGQQLIFDGFKTVNDVRAASENIKAAQQNFRFTSSQVRLNLRTAFVNLLKAQELIKVAEEIVKIRLDNFELITLRHRSGLEHRGALLTAEANLAEAEFELAQAKRDVVLAQRQLTKEMGRMEFKPMYAEGNFIVFDDAKDKPDFETLVEHHPSLLQAVAKKSSADFGIKSARANFIPQLSAQAGVDQGAQDWSEPEDQWNAGVNLTIPIFEGGLRRAQVAQARATYHQAQANERSIRDGVIVNLERTWVTLRDSMEMVEVQRKSLVASEERSKIAEAQYSTGFITFDNWIIIENDLVKAKKAYLEAQANALLAEANWIQAKGETLEYAL